MTVGAHAHSATRSGLIDYDARYDEKEMIIMGIFAKMSGLNKLAMHYPATGYPTASSRKKQTVKIGFVRYRSCVTVDFSPQGLFVWVRPPLGRQAKLLIPWNEVKRVMKGRLYGKQGVLMSIGEPEVGQITLYKELFELAKAYLHDV